VEGGSSSLDPDSVMLDLLLRNAIEPHNDFVEGALRVLNNVQNGMTFTTDKMPLRLVREEDCMHVDSHDFESVVRANATQSLKYGQGADVKYDFAQVEQWVVENVLKNAPMFDDRLLTGIPLSDEKKANVDAYFKYIGEGYTRKSVIGGIEQEEIPNEVAGAIIYKELGSLNAVQTAKDRLEECMGYLDSIGSAAAQEPNMTLDTFCATVLHLVDDQLSDFGSAAATFRTAVCLKHLDSLMDQLDRRVKVGDDVMETVNPIYRVALPEDTKEELEAAYDTMGLENLKLLHQGYESMIADQFINFAENLDAEATTFNSGGMFCGVLEITAIEEGYFSDMPWFTDNFPEEICIQHLEDCFKLLKAVIARLDD